MKPAFYALTALASITLAAPVYAQTASPSADQSSGSSTSAQPAGNSSDQYSGVDTSGVREDVKAPYGGRNQAQADAKEAPVTDRLNQMQLKGDGQAQPR